MKRTQQINNMATIFFLFDIDIRRLDVQSFIQDVEDDFDLLLQ